MIAKKTMLIAAAAGLAGLGALASLAAADQGWKEGGRWMGHGRQMFWQVMIERYDANKDGKISQDEITNNRQSWYAEFDVDKDGKLSLAEFEKLWLKAKHRKLVREFQFLDADGDGIVTLVEYQSPMADIVAERDRNGDGALSREDRRRGEHRGKHRWRQQENRQDDGESGEDSDSDAN